MSKATRILVVDDEAAFAETMVTVLRLRGFDAQVAPSGKFALQMMKSADFDLVITDISMPGMDGIEFIRQMRYRKPTQRIIVATGFPSMHTQKQALRLGALHYIAKPFSGNRLLEVVKQAFNENEEGLLGCIQLSTEDLIQLYALQGKSVVLEIHRRQERGLIYFDAGTLVHAKTDNHIGKKAFYEILSWKSGRFHTRPRPLDASVMHSIGESAAALLLKEAQRQDERRKNVPPHSNTEEGL